MPRRSLGCKECRRRKIGCDLTKPECQKCLHYGVRCPGYEDPRNTLRFVQYVSYAPQPTSTPTTSLVHSPAPSAASQSWLPYDPVRSYTPPRTPGTLQASAPQRPYVSVSTGLQHVGAWHDYSSPNSTTSSSELLFSENLSLSDDDDDDECKGPEIVALSTRNLYRLQWSQKFLELYDGKPQFEFLTSARLISSSVPLFSTALEALSLAGLGTQWLNQSNIIEMPRMLLKYDREGVQREARSCYAQALSLLAREVSREPLPYQRKRQRLVFMSIQMLRYFEGFDNQQSNSFDGIIAHNHGAIQYLRACGPSIISKPLRNGKWPAEWLLLGPLRTSVCLLGIMERKAVLFAEPKWHKIGAPAVQAYNQAVPASQATEITLSLPQLLEAADKLTSKDTEQWQSLVAQMLEMRQHLDDWLVGQSDLLEFYDVRDCSALSHLVGGTLIRGYSYFADAWVFRLLMTCTLLRATLVCPCIQMRIADLQREIYASATDLARISPSWLDDCPQRTIWYLDFPLVYFKLVGMQEELKWIQAVQKVAELSVPGKPPGRQYCHQRWRPADLFMSAAAPATFSFPLYD
ncbi:hypothetical protein K431DRAFT_293375 [Polychaeton citri CBS 116435]|uniref:Zn(2)-C6 fungal-type domain-containing protein n=1 Tax=Polychaeton citri CBS 116435 TaxID=1314669 RepID=A0A9P4Q9W0_9PEZI|nr:hypothetical protein K431DRAFT_293375 [Polychaeton citri CBS 116435]